jgi:hypothetical protein
MGKTQTMRATMSWTRSASISLSLAMLVAATAGCGDDEASSPPGAASLAEYEKVRPMSDMYGEYLTSHGNQPPKDEPTFRAYLTSKQDLIQKLGLTIDQMFISPRSDQPLAWVYGMRPPTGVSGFQYFAYEKTPVGGKRLAIGARGMFEELDEAQFKKIFPNVK